ncbi:MULTISPECIES: DUF2061 domain-containing protein [unclassified Candidatus Frackibacter]|uniref:DUF2061 domain-containing protein n=1 Tax=unclassified Candidatus Frackibacter TaxID=2648818 RepID=UPI00079663B7|nr:MULTISPECIES: DUF2061 domain-containing protein [unclassified Candidatus Frackibacter]KXS44469.1 MAG: hypothetical protein AWU54_739 [Candidatus Frackibacter sp. T328-2]SDC77951.1 Uncharacterized membrane protein [Candidatus Frackibacter sp. WG11]SEM90891.1 Uncharacterized membrane protein [Candidatus Frackibacter sp. WG12]SFL99748.1 Uncharacterized membrane protein [Candidatus Frackibacter sp. WG13]
MSDKLRRILKSITWRITATSTTMAIVYFLTGELEIAGSVALIEVVLKILIYYLHETIWDKATMKGQEENESNNIEIRQNDSV